MSWTMVLHLLYQMQDTERRNDVCYNSVAITASGKASHWNIALKLLKEAKEYDNRWIELKTLVEHEERDTTFSSTPCRERTLWTSSRKRN